MHRTIRRTLVGLAAGSVMLLGTGVAQASTQPLGDNWTLDSPSNSTTSYTAQIQQPINPDGSSTWPAKRGVLPVQFKLTKSTSSEVTFESIYSDADPSNDYSSLTYSPSGLTIENLTVLKAHYSWLQGTPHGGSLRWTVNTDLGNLHVYYGNNPNFVDESLATGSGVNLLDAPAVNDLRFDTSGIAGGTFYDSWNHAKQLLAGQNINWVSLVVDSGWGGDQKLNVVDATVNESTKTMPVSTYSAPVQTNEPDATVEVVRYNDGVAETIATETLSSAQGDTGGVFRKVDGKYIYNLKAETLGKGGFKVYMVIDGQRVDSNPGVFSLK
jgi:hypothetical protein